MENTAKSSNENRVNGVDVRALGDTIKAVREDPDLGSACFRATNRWRGQALNETVIGDFYCAGEERSHKQKFVFRNDEAHVLLGNDDAANPVEFILHALAGCITTTTVYHAAARGIHIDELETSLEGKLDLQGLLQTDSKVNPGYENIKVEMKIKSNASDEQIKALKSFFPFSPVFDTLKRPVSLEVNVSVEK